MPSPPQLTNLVAWYKADAGVFQDTAGTTPAANGIKVGLWQDQSGAGNHILQATVGHQPTYATGTLNSLPSVTFLRASTTFLATSGNATLGIGTANWWIAAVYVTGASLSTYSTLLDFSATKQLYIPGPTATNITWYPGSVKTFADTIAANTAYWSELTCTAGVQTLYHAAVGTTPAADANTFTGGASIADSVVRVGYDTGATDYFSGNVCEILLYKAALNSTDQASLESYLSSRYTPPPYTFSASGLAISGDTRRHGRDGIRTPRRPGDQRLLGGSDGGAIPRRGGVGNLRRTRRPDRYRHRAAGRPGHFRQRRHGHRWRESGTILLAV